MSKEISFDLMMEIENINADMEEVSNLLHILQEFFVTNVDINDMTTYLDLITQHPYYRSLLDVIAKKVIEINEETERIVNDYHYKGNNDTK